MVWFQATQHIRDEENSKHVKSSQAASYLSVFGPHFLWLKFQGRGLSLVAILDLEKWPVLRALTTSLLWPKWEPCLSHGDRLKKSRGHQEADSLGLKVAEPTHRHYSRAVLILQCLLANLRCPHWWRHLSWMLSLHGKHLYKNISDLRPAVTARQMGHCRARRTGPLPESHPAKQRTFGSSPSFWSPSLILSASLQSGWVGLVSRHSGGR